MVDAPEGTDVICGITILLIASALAVGLFAILPLTSMSMHTIEKGMVWASVPWFASLYLFCRWAHRTKIEFVDDDDDSEEETY